MQFVNVTKNLSDLLWRHKAIMMASCLIIVLGNAITAVFFNVVQCVYKVQPITSEVFSLTLYSFAPVCIVALVLLALFLEALKAGWDKSAIQRAFDPNNATRKTDWLYTILYASNFSFLLGFLFTLGIGYFIGEWVRGVFGLQLLKGSHPLAAFLVLLICNSFTFYVFHYLIHTRFLWDLHKAHHSAEEMNVITNFRAHPMEMGIREALFAFPAALLGATPGVTVFFSFFTGFVVLMQHSYIDWELPFVEKYLFFGAAGHRLHHSKDPKHYSKNLGYVVWWDLLFGTFLYEEKAGVTVGIEKDAPYMYNSGNIKTEIWGICLQAYRSFFQECFKKA